MAKENYHIHQVIKKPDIVGRIMYWVSCLHTQSKHQITCIGEFSGRVQFANGREDFAHLEVVLDDASNMMGSSAGIMLEGQKNLFIKQLVKFNSKLATIMLNMKLELPT